MYPERAEPFVSVAPIAIGAAGDAFGDIAYGFRLVTAFAALLFAGFLLNWLSIPHGAC